MKQILITGCARSGTSMVAGIVHRMGLFGGRVSPANRNNRKGMYENEKIKKNLMKPYLRRIGADELGQNPLPKLDYKIDARWQEKVMDVLVDEGLPSSQEWYYKGAKMCLVWRQWHYAFPDAKWIIVRRPKQQIVASCERTSFMSKIHTRDGWGEWVEYHLARFEEMKKCVDCVEIWSDKIVEGDKEELQKLLNYVGGDLIDMESILDFISPSLYSNIK